MIGKKMLDVGYWIIPKPKMLAVRNVFDVCWKLGK